MFAKLLRIFRPKDSHARIEPAKEDVESCSSGPANRPWIGVDLDGTLAEYQHQGSELPKVGKPIPLMKKRVQQWTDAGWRVKVMTARANLDDGPETIRQWLTAHGFPPLEVTSQKDFDMIELWDDRAIQVIRNTGKPVVLPSQSAMPKGPMFGHEAPGDTMELGETRLR